jgi:hypothetical protein
MSNKIKKCKRCKGLDAESGITCTKCGMTGETRTRINLPLIKLRHLLGLHLGKRPLGIIMASPDQFGYNRKT